MVELLGTGLLVDGQSNVIQHRCPAGNQTVAGLTKLYAGWSLRSRSKLVVDVVNITYRSVYA